MIEENIEVVETTTTRETKRNVVPPETRTEAPQKIRQQGQNLTCAPCSPCAAIEAPPPRRNRSLPGRMDRSEMVGNVGPLPAPPREEPPQFLPPGNGNYIINACPATYMHNMPDGTVKAGGFRSPQILGQFRIGPEEEQIPDSPLRYRRQVSGAFEPQKASSPVFGPTNRAMISYQDESWGDSGSEDFSSKMEGHLDDLDSMEISNLERNMAEFQDERRNAIMNLLPF